MNAEQKELFRKAILNVLDANRTRYGLTVTAIGFKLQVFAFTPANCGGAEAFLNAIADEIEYLTGKELVEEVTKEVSAENRAWRLTIKGFQFVDSRN